MRLIIEWFFFYLHVQINFSANFEYSNAIYSKTWPTNSSTSASPEATKKGVI